MILGERRRRWIKLEKTKGGKNACFFENYEDSWNRFRCAGSFCGLVRVVRVLSSFGA